MSQSHLFVTRGDLTHLRCDAWMLPSDKHYSVVTRWTQTVPGLEDAVAVASASTPEFAAGDVLATPLSPWSHQQPLPVLTAVPLYGVDEPEDVAAAVTAFIRIGAEAAHARPRLRGSTPLLAMPAFGTGGGGGAPQRGPILRELVRAARVASAEEGVDVALVLRDESDLAMAQAHRRATPDREFWSSLSPRLLGEAKSLAAFAAVGRLVPFMGSGVSATAGLPTWQDLISSLAATVKLDDAQQAALRHLSFLDQANLVADLMKDEDMDFRQAIAKMVRSTHYGLAPALLASLPVDQAVTLNYDDLFERASNDAGRPVTVLPEPPSKGKDRWLLKLHGSISDPNSIVLTRDDYLGYGSERGALSAIVKALLFTHKLLFVGFGLGDDHVHAIVHDVRKALPPVGSDFTFGTALMLKNDPLQARLWKGKLDVLAMDDGFDDQDQSDPPRTLEIFLDCLLAHAVNSQTFLLKDGYRDSLTEAEQLLRQRLTNLAREVTAAERQTSSWPRVAEALGALGWSPYSVAESSRRAGGRAD